MINPTENPFIPEWVLKRNLSINSERPYLLLWGISLFLVLFAPLRLKRAERTGMKYDLHVGVPLRCHLVRKENKS